MALAWGDDEQMTEIFELWLGGDEQAGSLAVQPGRRDQLWMKRKTENPLNHIALFGTKVVGFCCFCFGVLCRDAGFRNAVKCSEGISQTPFFSGFPHVEQMKQHIYGKCYNSSPLFGRYVGHFRHYFLNQHQQVGPQAETAGGGRLYHRLQWYSSNAFFCTDPNSPIFSFHISCPGGGVSTSAVHLESEELDDAPVTQGWPLPISQCGICSG